MRSETLMPNATTNGHQPPSEIITANEVAALLRMTPAWVYAETRCNRIPHMRLGRYFRYRRSAIEAWMTALENGSHEVR
jgi:excisionase family DNA binding protein